MSSLVLTGDTSGQVTIAAPAVAGTTTLTLPATTGTVLNDATVGVCRAWVNWNGTSASPITPRASFNVSSVTKASTGQFTINFTNALQDANYAPVCSHDNTLVNPGGTFGYWVTGTPTASNIPVSNVATNSGASVGDPTYACWAFFR